MVIYGVKAVHSVLVLVYRPVERLWQYFDRSITKLVIIMSVEVLVEIFDSNIIQELI